MGKSYRPYHPDQEFLLPPSLREWLPENHLVYFVSDVVDNLTCRRWMRRMATSSAGSRPTIRG
jgi:hypothetical protein